MKTQQLGYVLMVLIAVGVIGLIFRIFAAGSDEVTLQGLVPVSQESTEEILIRGHESETELVRFGSTDTGFTWFVDDQPIFAPKLDAFWVAVSDLYNAQLVATNPANHQRIGVSDNQGIEVSFYAAGRSLQERFIVGDWSPEVRLCYLRRSGKDEVYGIPCPQGLIFDPDPDGWRNPVAASIRPDDIVQVEFTYPEEEFAIVVSPDGEWFVSTITGQSAANQFAVNSVLNALQLVVSSGFATEEEASALNFAVPDAMVRIVTSEDAASPTTRLRFLDRDDASMYLAIPSRSTVFIIDRRALFGLLLSSKDFRED